jgi:hypothetical protein
LATDIHRIQRLYLSKLAVFVQDEPLALVPPKELISAQQDPNEPANI